MPSEEVRILILEDAIDDADLCKSELQRAGLRFIMRHVDTRAEFEAELDRFVPDLILSDFTLPGDFDGLMALELARRRHPDVPFVFVSGTLGEERAVEAMQHGAADYVLKDRMARLGPAVLRALERAQLRKDKERAETALHDSEAKYHGLIEQASDGIFVTDREGKILLVNSRYCEMLGYSKDELLQLNIAATYPEEERDAFIKRLAQLSTVKSRLFERMMRRKDGTCFPVEISVKFTTHGTHQGIVRDITERRQQQDRIARLNRIYAVLSSINSAIVRIRERQGLLEATCRIAVEHGGFGIAWIGTLNPETLEITPEACAGVEADSFLAHSRNTAQADASLDGGVAGRAIREKRAVYSNDLLADPTSGGARRQEAVRRGYRSVITLPLLVEDMAAGNLSLFAKEANFFNDEEVELLTELAANISFALEHIASQQKIEKLSRIRAVSSEINVAIVRIREREALLREACRIASERGGFEVVWIGALDQEKQQVRPVAWTGCSAQTAHAVSWDSMSRAKGALGEAVLTRAPSVRDDIETQLPGGNLRQAALEKGCRSTACLPLVVDDRVTNLVVLFATGRGFFDQDELALLGEVASNISFALESIARQEKIERLSRIRLVLGEINAAIVRIHSKQELFDEACRIAVDAGRFKFAWLGIVERDALQIRPVASAGVEAGFLDSLQGGASLDDKGSRGPGLSARAVLGKKPVVVNDTQNDPRILRKQAHLERNINSVAILPLLVADEAIGILALHAAEVGFFDEDEMKLLSELAGDIAFALQTIEKQERLDYLSYYDTLTGLPNRTLFIDRTGQQLRGRGGETPLVAVVLINLERFRNINETFGRRGGDALLEQVARRLEDAFRGKDYLARTAADSFGVIMRGMRDAAVVAHSVENQILECFRRPFALDGTEVRVAAKAGIAMFPADGTDADILFKNAEAALKKARDSAERYLFYAAEMNARAAHVLSLETRLRKAVEAQQFVLHYQPKFDLFSGAVCGLEALIRWQEPGAGLVAPGTFIPVLEETGLILEAGKWVLGRALADYRDWVERGCRAPRIAVNVSAIQLQQRDFADMVIEAVHEAGNNPEALELEVTESLIMRDVEASIRKLAILRATGIHIAMDDFGTGYSSLSNIARLPINSVKIDRSFINGMGSSDQDMAIVTTIITLAHSLNLRVVAEGVETEGQSRVLKLLKCDEAQGFLFSKPVPAAQIEPLLRAQAAKPPDRRATSESAARRAPLSRLPRTDVKRPRRRPSRTPKRKRH